MGGLKSIEHLLSSALWLYVHHQTTFFQSLRHAGEVLFNIHSKVPTLATIVQTRHALTALYVDSPERLEGEL